MSSGPTSSSSSSSSPSGASSEPVRREPEPPLLLDRSSGGASDGTSGVGGGWAGFRGFNFQDFINPPTDLSTRGKIAWGVALAADLLQVAFFPAFFPGFLSPLNVAMDTVVAAVMIWLLGWHIAFIPSFALEMVPGVEIAPTWTIAVWIVTKSPFRKSGV